MLKGTLFRHGRIKLVSTFPEISLKFKFLITGRINDVIQGHYQKHLLSLIFDRKTRGLNTVEINRKLMEMGYLSVRGKPPMSNHVRGMISKNRVRPERFWQFQRVDKRMSSFSSAKIL